MSGKVLSIHLQAQTDGRYLVEHNILEIEDALEAFEASACSGYIRYQTYLMTADHLREYLLEKCRLNDYEYSAQEGDVPDEDAWNSFLFTHFFRTKTYDRGQALILRLNSLSQTYLHHYEQLRTTLPPFDINSNHHEDTGGTDPRILAQLAKNCHNFISKIECMNIGHGNFSVGYNDAMQPLAMFDIGMYSSSRDYSKLKVNSLDEHGISVISHYDYDHICGVRFLDGVPGKPTKKRLWILPELPKTPTITAKMLLDFLEEGKNGNCIFLPDINYAQTPFDPNHHVLSIGNTDIYRGNEKAIDHNQSTSENARCLICLITGHQKKMLLPGDALYDDFPVQFSVDYLLIPHHGCRYHPSISAAKFDVNALQRRIVCAGPPNKKKHPNITHLRCLGSTPANTVLLADEVHFYQADGTEHPQSLNPKHKTVPPDSELLSL